MPKVETAKRHWNRRYAEGHNSGAGSYGEPLARKIDWLSRLRPVRSITDVGCGDFNFGANLLRRFSDATYIGLDTSEVIIRRNRRLYSSERVSFRMTREGAKFPVSDLVLCVDVLFHILLEQQYQEMLQTLELSWRKYLAISAYEYDGFSKVHVCIRKFDPEIFGKPVLREVIEEDGQMYFYIFER
jgi:SAM-dependent methyltransferase